jgi:predicted RNA binding protein YcfA (HicA-like mRNA interferase family)
MPIAQELIQRIVSGQADANVLFSELCGLLRQLGFNERIRGSHHIFRRPGTREKINLQPDGSDAKAYQVRQVRKILVKYGITNV